MSDIHSISPLYSWPKPIKLFLLGFLFLLTSGVVMGLGFLYYTTTLTPSGAVEHYRGSSDGIDNLLDIKEKYPKPISELLMTTHNHMIGFAFIFIILGGFFYFNSIVRGKFKTFLLAEPFMSTWITFMSLWGIRYIDQSLVYLTIITAILTYLSYFLIVSILTYELLLKKS